MGGGGKGVIEISAERFESEYSANENLARKKYNRKQLQITGKISEIENVNNKYFLLILENGLQCFFDYESHKNAFFALHEGLIVIVKGVYIDYGHLQRGLTQCYLLEILSVR